MIFIRVLNIIIKLSKSLGHIHDFGGLGPLLPPSRAVAAGIDACTVVAVDVAVEDLDDNRDDLPDETTVHAIELDIGQLAHFRNVSGFGHDVLLLCLYRVTDAVSAIWPSTGIHWSSPQQFGSNLLTPL